MVTSTSYDKDPNKGNHKDNHDKTVGSTDPDKVITNVDTPVTDIDVPVTATRIPFQSKWGYPDDIGTAGKNPQVAYDTGGGLLTPNFADDQSAAVTREVQPEELVSNQLTGLLGSDSKYIQDARRQGLEQSNAMGGLGGTLGVGAAQTSATRAALPIAQQDAATYMQTAKDNMQALNEFQQLNHQRATQMALGEMDSSTRLNTANINASASLAATKLQTAAQRDIANLDNRTKMAVTEMQGTIQARLADNQFRYNQILNDAQYAAELAKTQMQGEYGLAGEALASEWDARIQSEINALNRESTYTSLMTTAYDGYLNRLSELNGQEMDDAARTRAAASIAQGTTAMFDLLAELYPDVPPIEFNLG